ncbi:MAG: hypothetical protein KGL39_51505 [Patescibacteria group bacterium]|nr:hypothetical protein [Patescibacteria group bacterium]
MRDDDLIIRHVRLCADCGRPANHANPCDIDAQLRDIAAKLGMRALDARRAILHADDKRDLLRSWRATYARESATIERHADEKELDRFAEKARERHIKVQDQARAELVARRRHMRPGERLDAVLIDALVSPGLPTPDFIPSGSHGGTSTAPPDAESIDFDPSHMIVISSRLEAMEAERDAARGLAPARNWAMASSEQKDTEILSARWRGVHADVVSEAAPWLGSARTIRRIRSEHGLDVRGHERVAKSVA